MLNQPTKCGSQLVRITADAASRLAKVNREEADGVPLGASQYVERVECIVSTLLLASRRRPEACSDENSR